MMNIRVAPPPTIDAETFWRHACWLYLRAAFNGATMLPLRQLAFEMRTARAYLDGLADHPHTGDDA